MSWWVDNQGNFITDNLGNRIWIGPVEADVPIGMQCLVTDLLISVTADSSHTNYPVANVIDGHPSSPWKGNSVDTATLTATVAAGANAVGIAGTNAETVVITITDPNAVYFAEYEFSGGGTEDSYFLDDSYFNTWDTDVDTSMVTTGSASMVAATFNTINLPISVEILLTAPTGTIIQAGQLEIGSTVSVQHNPNYGMIETGETYSLKKILSNGARWTKIRNNVRKFSGVVQVERETDFYNFMSSIAREIDIEPRFWWLTNLDSANWLVFAELEGWPVGSHDFVNYSTIQFALIEVL